MAMEDCSLPTCFCGQADKLLWDEKSMRSEGFGETEGPELGLHRQVGFE